VGSVSQTPATNVVPRALWNFRQCAPVLASFPRRRFQPWNTPWAVVRERAWQLEESRFAGPAEGDSNEILDHVLHGCSVAYDPVAIRAHSHENVAGFAIFFLEMVG